MPTDTTTRTGIPSPAEWEAFFEKEAAFILEETHAPGVAVLLCSNGEPQEFEKSWGLARVDPEVSLELDTPIRAGSISKLVTAIAVQQLVESGDLTLDAAIGEIVSWKLPHGYGRATIRDLLTHRAGIGERFARQSTPQISEIVNLSGYLQKSLPPPVAKVGETVTYSNFGISLAGLAVEIVSGQTFADYARDKIFQPLGMDTATFLPDPAMEQVMAEGYNWIFGGHRRLPLRHWKPYPASSLTLSPRELGTLMRSFLGGQSPVLERPTALFEEQTTVVPGVPGMGLSFWLDKIHGQKVAWHTGHMPGHRTGFYLFPDSGFGIVLYYNTDEKILRPFLDKVADFAFANSPPQRHESSPAHEDCQGVYRHSWYPHHYFGKSAALLGKEGEELAIESCSEGITAGGEHFTPLEDDVFLSSKQQTRIGFIRDESSRITGLYTGGRDRYEKISSFETSRANITSVLLCVALFVICGCLTLSSLIGGVPKLPLLVSWSLLATCAANLGFVVSMTVLTGQGAYKVTQDVPTPVAFTLSLPVIGAGAWIVAMLSLFSTSGFSIVGLAVIILVTFAELLFLWFLHYWRLLGWRYR